MNAISDNWKDQKPGGTKRNIGANNEAADNEKTMDRNYWAQSYIFLPLWFFDSYLFDFDSISIKIKHYVNNKILETT